MSGLSKTKTEPVAAEIMTAFRGAMRRLTSTVTVVSAAEGNVWVGMTMTAVISLSMAPPSLLISVNRSTKLHSLLESKTPFCVNLLRCDHEDVATAFGGKMSGAERFKVGDWRNDSAIAPYLVDAESNIFCDIEASVSYGTHTAFVGRVLEVRSEGEIAPLLYGNGHYGAMSAS